MAMSIIWCVLTGAAFLFAAASGRADAVAAAALSGAGEGVQLAIALAGPMLLWSGFARVCENAGLTAKLARLLRPLLGRIFPKTRDDPAAFGSISANFIANLLGLGNAATPLGIEAVRRMREKSGSAQATDEMCRFIVLNTASVQLIPATVAAVRAGCGCSAPFDILPAVWVTSLGSVAAGLGAAAVFARLRR